MVEFKEINIPGDKSISHRAIMMSAIGNGETIIENILISEDVMATINCFREMGVSITLDEKGRKAVVKGVGFHGLKSPNKPLYCGNSGTTMRLMAGILVAQNFDSILIGDESLNDRPMNRIIKPLTMMGANIFSGNDKDTPPLYIKSTNKLKSIDYNMEIASAQVKSSILLASLYTEKNSNIYEEKITRNHTENMISYFRNCNWNVEKIIIPGDISSAAYFIVYGILNGKENIMIRDIGLNPTRTGILDVLKSIGAEIKINNLAKICNEEVGDIFIEKSELSPFTIDKNSMGRLIDEIPILAIVACFINGISVVKDAKELRVKETDRINAICRNLEKIGVEIEEKIDGFIINGKSRLKSGAVNSFNDHRIAMSFEIMDSIVDENIEVINKEVVNISFPNFFNELEK